MSKVEIKSHHSREELDRALAAHVVAVLARALADRGQATLVVSGGTTPLGLFRRLSGAALDWHRVRVALADERWVPPDHDDSNEKLVRRHLLVERARAARLVALKTGHKDPLSACATVDRALAELGRFDLVILGMGADGHTASLFPGATALAEGLDMESGHQCVAVTPPAAPHRRMSMTLPRLLDSDSIVIHITGDDKRQVLDRALAGNDPDRLPIAAVLHQQRTPVEVYVAP